MIGKCINCNKEVGYSRITKKKIPKKFCSAYCNYQHHKKELVRKRRGENRCIECGKKVKPVLKYYARCPEHMERARELRK